MPPHIQTKLFTLENHRMWIETENMFSIEHGM